MGGKTKKNAGIRKKGFLIRDIVSQCNESIIEHLPILDQRAFIHVKWPRFKCDKCGSKNCTTSFKPKWVNNTGNMTREYENYCLKLLVNSTIKDVSEKLNTTEEHLESLFSVQMMEDNINSPK